jgi:hypothetical protein
MPYNLWAPGACQVTSPGSFMACPDGGDGTSAPDQFVAYRPDNGGSPIMPGEPMYLQSMQTGKFCRVVLFGGQQRVACDQSSTEGAAQLVYTGSGASYNNQPFINPGSNQPIYFGGSAAKPQAAAFLPPPIPTNTAISIAMPSRGFLRIDSTTAYAYCGNGNGTSPPELFIAVDPTDAAAVKTVRPGQRTLLKSVQTGLFLRLEMFRGDADARVSVQAPSAVRPPSLAARAVTVLRPPSLAIRQARPPPQPAAGALASAAASSANGSVVWGVLGDQASLETGTVFVYTVMGLSYMGEPLRTRGIFYPLLWSNTSTLNGSSGVAFTPVSCKPARRPAAGPMLRACAQGRRRSPPQPGPAVTCSLADPRMPPLPAAPPLMPNVLNNIRPSRGGTCRVDGLTSYMYCPTPGGAGNSTQEQFTAVRPDGTSVPAGPGQKVFLKSEHTGKYSRLVPVSGRSQMLYDQDTTATAVQLVYTIFGLSTSDGLLLIDPGGGQAIYFGAPSAQAPAAPLTFASSAAVPVASGAQYLINLALGNCRTDNASSYVSGVAA